MVGGVRGGGGESGAWSKGWGWVSGGWSKGCRWGEWWVE